MPTKPQQEAALKTLTEMREQMVIVLDGETDVDINSADAVVFSELDVAALDAAIGALKDGCEGVG